MIEGLSHITLVVGDLERAGNLLETIFDAEKVYESGDETFSLSRERFYLLAGIWIAIMEGEPLSERTYNHVALKVSEESLAEYEQRLRKAGVEFRTSRPRVGGEGMSLYFYDHDNHLFELHTGTLEHRLKAYEAVENSPMAALHHKVQTLAYHKYASTLNFVRALPSGFLNSLRIWTFSTGSYDNLRRQ